MLTKKTQEILSNAEPFGWILEPDAKDILAEAGLTVPDFRFTTTKVAAVQAVGDIGAPLAAKVVSPRILHKSDVGGVVVGIQNEQEMGETYDRFSSMDGFKGVHVEQMVSGVELIVGAKIDYQFGPVILLGIGGTGVEVYQDTAIRMAPLQKGDVLSMIDALKGKRWLEGYRGSAPVNIKALINTMLAFSTLVMDMAEHIESIDLNPVIATADACIVADARIMLAGNDK